MVKAPSVRIRAMRIGDYDAILALWKKSRGVGLSESDGREAIGRFLKRNPRLSLTATCNGRVIAAVLCGHDGRRGYLHHLAVAPTWRRRGIGRRLVAGCIDRLREQGIPKCNLFLFASNAHGRRFWRQIGWTIRADLRLVQRDTTVAGKGCSTTC